VPIEQGIWEKAEIVVGVSTGVGLGPLLGFAERELEVAHPGGNPGANLANLKSISHICHPILLAFVWELTE